MLCSCAIRDQIQVAYDVDAVMSVTYRYKGPVMKTAFSVYGPVQTMPNCNCSVCAHFAGLRTALDSKVNHGFCSCVTF